MKIILLVILGFIFVRSAETGSQSKVVECSQYCAPLKQGQTGKTCYSDGTCRNGCKEGAAGVDPTDSSCSKCLRTDGDKAYIKDEETKNCVEATKRYSRAHQYIPQEAGIVTDFEVDTKIFKEKLNIQDSYVGSGPCPFSQEQRIGKWYKLKHDGIIASEENKYVTITLSTNTTYDVEVYVDLASPLTSDNEEGTCLGRNVLETDMKKTTLSYPYDEEIDHYVFVSFDGIHEVEYDIQFIIGKSYGESSATANTVVMLTEANFTQISNSKDKYKLVPLKLKAYGMYMKSACVNEKVVKAVTVMVQFDKGDYYVKFDSLNSSRINMVERTDMNRTECFEFYDGQISTIQNIKEEDRRYGFSFVVKPLNVLGENVSGLIGMDTGYGFDMQIRMFMIMTEEDDVDIMLNVSTICPNACYESDDHGYCSYSEGRCACDDEKGYNGTDCHQMCYFNGEWHGGYENNYTKHCKFNNPHCDEWCNCEPGYVLNSATNECYSEECNNGGMKKDEDECKRGDRGCNTMCRCDTTKGFIFKNGKCIHKLCGDGKIDSYEEVDGSKFTEQCDGGLNCEIETCKCLSSFESNEERDSSGFYGCKEPSFPVYAIVLIVLGVVVILVVFAIILIIIIFTMFKYKRFDLEQYKKQQPVYYYYIHGSSSLPPSKENRYIIEPVELDFGNDQQASNIHETRFEKMQIKNYSKNKWMMVIFHTPNNPKFVFHFDKQVVFVRARSTKAQTTLYMTLNCTTKIREMKIPYTIWWSKSKGTLEEIADILMDKRFEDWSVENKNQMERLCKTVNKHIHYYLTIMTDAVSSTHIDMDELVLVEKPIAEGAMGKVYVGSYRSVTVAVKKFRWENLEQEEIDELKQEVMAECDIMAKLRNPFIANYMGSVTYIPQICMVMQFFVMGSLGEYLRKEKEDFLKMSYALKIRILFDTARGMQFLHENKIMHLDLKPDNLLVNSLYADAACCVKITDFGTSRFTKKTAKTGDKGLGTPIYLAPEGYRDEYTFGGDVFAFAVTAWEIFYQDEPYKDFKSLFDIKNYVESGKRLEIDETMPQMLKALIDECWAQQSSSRPTFEQICRKLAKVEEDAGNHFELDADVSEERVQQLVNDRTERLNAMLKELEHE